MYDLLSRGKIVVLFALISMMLLAPPSTAATSSRVSQNSIPASPLASAMDFTLTANPTSLTMPPGATQSSAITATSINGFVGTIYLATFSYPLIASLSSTSLILSSGGTATTTLTVSAPSTTPPANETVFVYATGGCSLVHFTEISARITGPDFIASAQKTLITIDQGGSGTSTIDLASKNGFAGTVTLSTFTYPLMSSIVPATVTLTSGGAGTSTLTVDAPVGTEPGNYTVYVTASSGSLTHYLFVDVTVNGPTFAMSAYREFLTLLAGGATNSSTISVSPVGGFTGTVTLTPSASSVPPGLTLLLDSPSVTLPPTRTATLTLGAPAGTKAGSYFVSVTGTIGTITKSESVYVTVKGPDFDISTDPFFLTVVAGGASCTSTISVAPLNGFSGSVSLTRKADPSLTTSLSSNSVTVPGTSILTVSAPLGTKPGFYSVDINGTSVSPAIIHPASVSVVVIGPDFSLSANPAALTVTAGGFASMSTISMGSEFGFSGTVGLTASSFDLAITAVLSLPSISGSGKSTLSVTAATGTAPGSYYSVEVNGTSGALTHSIFLQITVVGPDFTISSNPTSILFNAGVPTTSTITIAPSLGFASPVDLSAFSSSTNLNASILPTTVTSSSYTATLSVNSSIPGVYNVDILATGGGLFHDLIVPVHVTKPDFTISAGAVSPAAVLAGSSGSSVMTVTSVGGFAGPVTFSASAQVGLTCQSIPNWSGSGTATLTCTAMAAGDYTVTVTGTATIAGRTVHHATGSIVFHVVAFSIAASPAMVTVNTNIEGTSTITITGTNQFNGDVSLSADNTACSLNHATVTGSGTATLSCTFTSTGTKTVTITGSSGSLSPTAVVTFTVSAVMPNFTISSIAPASFASGATGTSTVTLAAQNGFYSNVDLSYTVSPSSGLSVSLSPTSFAYGSGTSTATFSSSTPGTYTVTITGKSGGLSNSATVTVTVTAAPVQTPTAPATILGLDPTLFYGLVGGIVAVVVVGGVVMFMRGKKTEASP